MEKLLAEWKAWQIDAAKAHLRARAAMAQQGRGAKAIEWQHRQAFAYANAESCFYEITEEWQ